MSFGFWVGGTSPGLTAAPVSRGVVAVGDGAAAVVDAEAVEPLGAVVVALGEAVVWAGVCVGVDEWLDPPQATSPQHKAPTRNGTTRCTRNVYQTGRQDHLLGSHACG
jgi:hypothetical protein